MTELEKAAREHLSSAEERREALKEFKLTITAKAGTEGKLFGSIGTADIAEALQQGGLQDRAQRSAHAERPAAHGRRAHRRSASARRRRCAAGGVDRRGRVSTIGGRPRQSASRRDPSRPWTHRCRRTLSKRSRPSSAACCSIPPPGTTSRTSSSSKTFTVPITS